MKPWFDTRKLVATYAAIGALAAAVAMAGDESPDAKKKAVRPKVEVVFCIDTTGSMGGLIAGAQQKVWSIVNGIVSGKPVPEVKVGLVAYRDKGDAYVTQVTDLNADLDSIHQTLFGFRAQGGGDTPESVNQALADAVSKISWAPKGEKVYRVVFLVGDAPPHMDYADDAKYPETCKAAVEKDIVINTIRCGNSGPTETAWREIALKSEGQYTSIEQSGGVTVVTTPHDAKLAELSGKLVGTAVYGGERELRAEAKKAQLAVLADAAKAKDGKMDAEKLAVEADKGAFRARAAEAAMDRAAPCAPSAAVAGMGMGGRIGGADMVNAFAVKGEEALKSIKETDLPEEMQKMSADERKAHLEKKVAERKEIQKQIDELSKQRAQYIQEEMKKRGSGDKGFDSEVLRMLKEQGTKKGIEYGDEAKK